jgi:hypothetical protein
MLMPPNPAFAPIPLGDDLETVIFGVVRTAIHTLYPPGYTTTLQLADMPAAAARGQFSGGSS